MKKCCEKDESISGAIALGGGMEFMASIIQMGVSNVHLNPKSYNAHQWPAFLDRVRANLLLNGLKLLSLVKTGSM